MGTESTSIDDIEFADSTVYHQSLYKFSNNSQDDINSSLVFGNDLTSNHIQTQHDQAELKTFKKDSTLNDNDTQKVERVLKNSTQNDNTFELLNNPNETPFLAKLKDPFEDEDNDLSPKFNFQTPSNTKVRNDLVVIQNESSRPYNFATLRNEADASCLEYETEANDTILPFGNKQNNQSEADTQVIENSPGNDTLKFVSNSTQNIADERPPIIHEETQIDEDKLNVQKDTQQVTAFDDTQLITPHLHESLRHSRITDGTDEGNVFRSSSQRDLHAVQIPSTVEKYGTSCPQVVNTQEEEEPDSTPSNRKVDLSNKPVFSSSQKLGEEEEIRTDDERDNEKSYLLGVYCDDSLLTHKHKTKRRYSESEMNDTNIRKISRPNNSENDTMNKLTGFNNLSKTPMSLKNWTQQQIVASPSEIDESSPGIKKTDILGFHNKSLPSILNSENTTASTGINVTNEQKNQVNPPSSPTNDRKKPVDVEQIRKSMGIVGIEHSVNTTNIQNDNNSENNSSDLEDIDIDYYDQKNTNNTRRKGWRRRSNFIVNSRSQSQEKEILNQVGNVKIKEMEADDMHENHISEDEWTKKEGSVLRKENHTLLAESLIISRKSVWVSFKFNMYTGTISRIGTESLIVEFEEGGYTIKNSDLFLLDIRIGDMIRTRTSKYKFIVTGLSYSESGDNIKCIRGYNHVFVQRISKGKTKHFDEIGINLSQCYMELSDWIQHQQKFQFMFGDQDILKLDCSDLFLNNFNLDVRRTPTRGTRISNTPEAMEIDPKYKNGPLSSPTKKADSRYNNAGNLLKLGITEKMFFGMVFCLTFGKNIDEERKEKIKNLIEENGGSVLDDGLHRILNYSRSADGSLILESEVLTGFSFGAVISNSYCRSAKYIQALALGWPILSDYYIFDCIKDNTKINQWPIYLLPAGQSQMLRCVKSLDVFKFRSNYENNKELAEQLNINHNFLQNNNIIIIDNKINLKTLETCEFIFHAFGAKDIAYCNTSKDLMTSIKSYKNGHITVYDNSESIKSELQLAQSDNTTSRTRTQTRSKTKTNSVSEQLVLTANNTLQVGFINWEWVVQCVISGYIWDPEYLSITL